jgi:hypothetical protein
MSQSYSNSYDEITSSDNSDSTEETVNTKEKKKRPLKTEKMALKDAVKTAQERSYYLIIDKFFKNCDEKNIEKMCNIILKKKNDDTLSLRTLSWFVSQQNEILLDEDNKKDIFNVKIIYKTRLETFSKKYFDPFRRGKRFDYYYKDNECIETTLCQLMFFKWLFDFDLLNYIEKNYDTLKSKMRNCQTIIKNHKIIKKEKQKEKKNITKKTIEYEKNIIKDFVENDTNELKITF